MINFIYGEDIYRSQETLQNLERDFVKSYGDLNVDKFEGSDLTKGLMASKVFAMPFLGEKRLVIVKNLLSDSDKTIRTEVESFLDKMPETTEVMIWEAGSPDKRDTLFKKLDKLPSKQIFYPLDGFGLRKWIEDEVAGNDCKISSTALAKLIIYVGPDLFRLKNEITILANYALGMGREQIETEDVDKFVEPSNTSKVFDLTDAIVSKSCKKAITVLNKFRKSGEDDYRILNLIIHQIRTMLVVDDLSSSKMSADQIAKESRIHPFVVTKTLYSLKNFTKQRLIKMYGKLGEIDMKIKSGRIDIGCALELLVVDFCEK